MLEKYNCISEHAFLLIQPIDNVNLVPQLEQLCSNAGLELIPTEHPVASFLIMKALTTGRFDLGNPYFVWKKQIGQDQHGYNNETPPEIQQLLRSIRGQVSSFSATVPEDFLIDLEGAAHQHSINLEKPSDLLNLVSLLMRKGKLTEAKMRAEDATQLMPDNASAWRLLGLVNMKLDNSRTAIENWEKALAIDPLDHLSIAALIQAYEKLGEFEKANDWHIRFQALGGSSGVWQTFTKSVRDIFGTDL